MCLESIFRIRLGIPQWLGCVRLIYGVEDEASNRIAPTNPKPVSRFLNRDGGLDHVVFSLPIVNRNASASNPIIPLDHCRSLPSVETCL